MRKTIVVILLFVLMLGFVSAISERQLSILRKMNNYDAEEVWVPEPIPVSKSVARVEIPEKSAPASLNILLLVGILGVVLVIGVGIFMGRKLLDKHDDADPNVVAYINQARAAGLGDLDIRNRLLQAGWDQTKVEVAFNEKTN